MIQFEYLEGSISMTHTVAGKCIAMTVACAGMAAEPEKVRRHFSE
jgi:hypothetical protein